MLKLEPVAAVLALRWAKPMSLLILLLLLFLMLGPNNLLSGIARLQIDRVRHRPIHGGGGRADRQAGQATRDAGQHGHVGGEELLVPLKEGLLPVRELVLAEEDVLALPPLRLQEAPVLVIVCPLRPGRLGKRRVGGLLDDVEDLLTELVQVHVQELVCAVTDVASTALVKGKAASWRGRGSGGSGSSSGCGGGRQGLVGAALPPHGVEVPPYPPGGDVLVHLLPLTGVALPDAPLDVDAQAAPPVRRGEGDVAPGLAEAAQVAVVLEGDLRVERGGRGARELAVLSGADELAVHEAMHGGGGGGGARGRSRSAACWRWVENCRGDSSKRRRVRMMGNGVGVGGDCVDRREASGL